MNSLSLSLFFSALVHTKRERPTGVVVEPDGLADASIPLLCPAESVKLTDLYHTSSMSTYESVMESPRCTTNASGVGVRVWG